VLVAYCWDMVLALLAVFGALAAFAGQAAVGARIITFPLPLQVVAALSSASYAAVLVIVASMLTRPQRWIRRAQIATLAVALVLAGVSLLVTGVTSGLDTIPLLVTLLFMLLDMLVIVVMTERRLVSWYTEPGGTPAYVLGALGFWVVSSAVLLIVDSVR
jgi:hypothetical protein